MSVVPFPGPRPPEEKPVRILSVEVWSDGATVVDLVTNELQTSPQWTWLYRRLVDAMGVVADRNTAMES